MPYIEKPTVKLYYSIGEVAEMFAVNTSLIRFWEKEFDIIKPTKNKKGNRMFTAEDIDNFKKIFSLVKGDGYTLHGAKERLRDKSYKPSTDSPVDDTAVVLEKLGRLRSELGELKQLF